MSERMFTQFRDPEVFARFNETALAIHTELNLNAALRRIVELACDLVGARYAALGIVGDDGFLADFITTGISEAQREAIGPLPHGHGLLGVLIREQRSLRLPDLRRHSYSSGFPSSHPPMTSFLSSRTVACRPLRGRGTDHAGGSQPRGERREVFPEWRRDCAVGGSGRH